MPNVSVADRVFLTADSEETPQHVACLATFVIPHDAPENYVHGLAERLRAQTTVAKPFNHKLKTVALRAIAPSWDIVADDEIDLDYHFRHSALPKPGGERELGMLVSRLHSRPLDPTRPLWEFHLIEGLEPNRFAIYFKVHHALMDGVGGVKRMQQMISPDPAADEINAIWTIGPSSPSGAPRPSTTSIRGVAGSLAGLGMAASRMAVGAVGGSDPDLAVPFLTPKSVINQRISRQRRVATQSFDVDRIRTVAAAGCIKINDVFLAICAGGLRRYLDELGELPKSSLIAGTPVNVREAGDESTTNAFSMIVVKLATEVADPVRRLAAIARSSEAGKNELRRLPQGAKPLYPALFMGPFIAQNLVGLGGRLAPPHNVAISNVPGPLDPQYLAGARLEAMYPIGLLYHGVGLMIALFTASGRLGVGFVGDRDSLPHLQRLAVYTGEALDELEQALGVPHRPEDRHLPADENPGL